MPLSPTRFYQVHLKDLHQCLLRSTIVRSYLTGSAIRLDGDELQGNDRFGFPFGTLSTVEFAHLFSIFDGSRVHVQNEKASSLDEAPPGLYINVINRRLLETRHKNRLGLVQLDQDGSAGLHIDHYFLKSHMTPVGLGTHAFTLCAITAHLTGLKRITLVAAGQRGIRIWPKLGFNATLDPEEIRDVPHLASCQTVQDVMRHDERWWDKNASQRHMVFDLSANSICWQRLIAYSHRKLSIGSASWPYSKPSLH